MNEQRTGLWRTVSIAIKIGKVCTNENDGKFEGYIHSGIGFRSDPVDRLAGRLADEINIISFNFFKFSSGNCCSIWLV